MVNHRRQPLNCIQLGSDTNKFSTQQGAVMPVITVAYPEGALPTQNFEHLADRLIAASLQAEGIPNVGPFRDFSSVQAVEIPRNQLYTTGRFTDRSTFRVDITVHNIIISERHRRELVKDATDAVPEAAGLDDHAAEAVWVLLHCVPEGHWGVSGHPVEHAGVRQSAADHLRGLSA
ncbi:tautomerase family protein [Nocardia transvalensis]|uniref:tautomerase family protein n=1 Tax=Nocardia transvalensis TaxID=37333 RepID=UPI0018930D01|nr:tautomerase family protein [Nocardia transvalensis]MBF6331087.1 tautomerase family protein [Nocardia transvalensis]